MRNLTVPNTKIIVGHPYATIRQFINTLRKTRSFTRAEFEDAWEHQAATEAILVNMASKKCSRCSGYGHVLTDKKDTLCPDCHGSGENGDHTHQKPSPPPFDAFLLEGLMRGIRTDDGFVWTLNAKAHAIGLKPLVRLTNEGLKQKLTEVMRRVKEASESSDFAMEVGQLTLFGSALDDSLPDYGDLDIAIRAVTKPRYASRLDMITLLHEDENTPLEQLTAFIKNNDDHIQIVQTWYLDNLGCDTRVIYEVDDLEMRLRKDQSNIISEETREHIRFR